MHYGIVVLVKCTSKEDALVVVKDFLEEYKYKVWDWFQIGGRWTNILAPMHSKFCEEAQKLLNPKGDKEYIAQSTVDANLEELQKIWESLGGKGQSPYHDHYKLPDSGGIYDVMPLKECLEVVTKRFKLDHIEAGKKQEEDAKKNWLEEIDKETGKSRMNYNMYGYCLDLAASYYRQQFFSECGVFNIESYNYDIPEDTENYMAVMLDIHN